MKILALVLVGYGALVLLVCIAGAIAGLLARRQDQRLSICPSCHEPIQGGYCANCRDIPAGWLLSARAIQDEDPIEAPGLPAWRGVVRRDREEARERTILDRRRQEAAGPPAPRTADPRDLEWAARTVLASIGCVSVIEVERG